MTTESPLKGKTVLVVDDEPDVLETVAEELDMCLVDKAQDYNTAVQYLASYRKQWQQASAVNPSKMWYNDSTWTRPRVSHLHLTVRRP